MAEKHQGEPDPRSTGETASAVSGGPTSAQGPSQSPRDAIIDALMMLAAEREWQDFTLSDVAARAGVSLADFREAFPSKGAVLAGLAKKIDREVLRKTGKDLEDESAKERLFDVLMRRLDALAPYKLGIEGVSEWARKDPVAAAALNGVLVNSMRFMLEAAGIDTEKRAGPLKVQGLVFAWTRILAVWLKDDEPGLARTMAALDRELSRGETLVGRVDDLDRLFSPLRLVAQSAMNAGRRMRDGGRSRSSAKTRETERDGSTA